MDLRFCIISKKQKFCTDSAFSSFIFSWKCLLEFVDTVKRNSEFFLFCPAQIQTEKWKRYHLGNLPQPESQGLLFIWHQKIWSSIMESQNSQQCPKSSNKSKWSLLKSFKYLPGQNTVKTHDEYNHYTIRTCENKF